MRSTQVELAATMDAAPTRIGRFVGAASRPTSGAISSASARPSTSRSTGCRRTPGRAYLAHVPATIYYTFEAIALAGLLVVQALRVGWRHALLGLAALVYAPFIVLRPDLRVVLYNILLVAITIASVYLHMRQAGDASGDASDA